MEIEKYCVAKSTAGHDKGELCMILDFDDKTALVCDGRQRRLNKPKRKNLKHIKLTSFKLNEEDALADSRLRKKLFELANRCNQEG